MSAPRNPAAAAKIRRRLTLERAVESVDPWGAVMRDWVVVGPVWASLSLKSAGGDFAAQTQEAAFVWDVTIRWRADVAPPMRFRLGGRLFDLRAASDPDGRKCALVCRCEEYSAHP